MKSLTAALIVAAFLFVPMGTQAQDNVPRLIPAGEYKCKVSREYKLRKCSVVEEGKDYILSLYEPGHLLQLEGVMYPSDHIGRDKRIFVEAKLKEDAPFMCYVDDEAAQKACREQTVMVELKKVSKKKWAGKVAIKYYWNAYEGDGAERRVSGFHVTVETVTVELHL